MLYTLLAGLPGSSIFIFAVQPLPYFWCLERGASKLHVMKRKILLIAGIVVAIVVGLFTGLFGTGI